MWSAACSESACLTRPGETFDRVEKEPSVLALVKNSYGVRHRSFASAVEAMSESAWSDWPLAGPRTVLFVLSYIAEHYQTPEQMLAGRFARGEIDETEYRQRLEVLRATPRH